LKALNTSVRHLIELFPTDVFGALSHQRRRSPICSAMRRWQRPTVHVTSENEDSVE